MSSDVDLTESFLPFQEALSDLLDVALELDFVYVRELGVLFPRVEVAHLRDQLLQFLDGLLEVAELLDAEPLDDSLLKRVLLDV